MTDISAILLAAAGPALTSLQAAAAHARRYGLSIELIHLPDTPHTAAARNRAATLATGAHLAFLDPADLCCDTWLLAAHAAATATPGRIVWHPEAVLHHAATPPAWSLQPDIEDARGDWVTLAIQNHWTASSLAPRDIHLEIPYPDLDWPDAAWAWNAATIAAGCRHKPVEGTAHLTSRPAPAPAPAPPSATLWRDRIGWAARNGRLGRAA